jgi:hypothetical protein
MKPGVFPAFLFYNHYQLPSFPLVRLPVAEQLQTGNHEVAGGQKRESPDNGNKSPS